MAKRTLVEILKQHKWDCDKDPHTGNKRFPAHTYLEVYDRLFSVYQNQAVNVLEIGILRGNSLKLWAEYFSQAHIYGADTFERVDWEGCKYEEVADSLREYDRVKLVKVNSCLDSFDERKERDAFLDSLPDGFFDIIIDDGSHELGDQIATFNNFKSKLSANGIYVIEDIGITDNRAFEPTQLKERLPEFQIIDMRYPDKHDNVLALYYQRNSTNFNHFEDYYASNHWVTAPEFQLDYIHSKQKEI